MAMNRDTEEMADRILSTWGAWRIGAGAGRGWGGVHEIEGGAARNLGEHANPIESEAIRDQMGDQESVLVDDLLKQHLPTDRKVVTFRYCGVPKVDGPRIIWPGWSPLPTVAAAVGIKIRAAEAAIDRSRALLMLQLAVARRIRNGVIGDIRRAA